MQKKPIIFLDFDGVLNTPQTWGKWPVEKRLDKDKIERVAKLAYATNAEIVISSSWRKFYSLAELRNLLRRVGDLNQDYVIDMTGGNDEHHRRGDEIYNWLKERNKLDHSFVVLDDMDPDCFTKVEKNLVQTNNRHGITDADVKRAAEILLEL